ncbi:hypothetical protein DFH06DRAFT_1343453 [Mycena polygramma]|nr:hypothetical protein DFH06DRAFT_1343453 [Mycena polygramma]
MPARCRFAARGQLSIIHAQLTIIQFDYAYLRLCVPSPGTTYNSFHLPLAPPPRPLPYAFDGQTWRCVRPLEGCPNAAHTYSPSPHKYRSSHSSERLWFYGGHTPAIPASSALLRWPVLVRLHARPLLRLADTTPAQALRALIRFMRFAPHPYPSSGSTSALNALASTAPTLRVIADVPLLRKLTLVPARGWRARRFSPRSRRMYLWRAIERVDGDAVDGDAEPGIYLRFRGSSSSKPAQVKDAPAGIAVFTRARAPDLRRKDERRAQRIRVQPPHA